MITITGERILESSYYDDVYRRVAHYRGPPEESPYYILWKAILNHIEPEDVVLDVGCGPGQFGELCVKKGIMYTGLDYSPEAIRIARNKRDLLEIWQKTKYHLMDVEEDQTLIKEGKYTVITFIEFLEHVRRDVFIVSKIPVNKKVIITSPNYGDPSHFRFFNSLDEITVRYEPLIDVSMRMIFSGDNVNGKVGQIYMLMGRKR
jgi:SAM-dependent methyltransferase